MEPRNRRRRASILIQSDNATLLVDTSPDCRQQLLDANVQRLDAVIYTHAHADHSHGIDDLRWVNVAMNAPIPIYSDAKSLETLRTRFGYVFEPLEKFEGRPLHYYKPMLLANVIANSVKVADLHVETFLQDHGFSTTLGLRIGNFAYSTDVMQLDTAALDSLQGVDTWIVDAYRYQPHPTHAHLDRTLRWIETVKPRRAVTCHMGTDLDYGTLQRILPSGVEPGYDGMVLEV